MKNLLDNISLKMKLIFLIIFPFLGFLLISALYLNQILVKDKFRLDFEKNLNELEPIGIVFSKDDKEFAELVTKNLNEMKKSGKLEEIYTKWFMTGIPPKNINFKRLH